MHLPLDEEGHGGILILTPLHHVEEEVKTVLVLIFILTLKGKVKIALKIDLLHVERGHIEALMPHHHHGGGSSTKLVKKMHHLLVERRRMKAPMPHHHGE